MNEASAKTFAEIALALPGRLGAQFNGGATFGGTTASTAFGSGSGNNGGAFNGSGGFGPNGFGSNGFGGPTGGERIVGQNNPFDANAQFGRHRLCYPNYMLAIRADGREICVRIRR